MLFSLETEFGKYRCPDVDNIQNYTGAEVSF